MKKKRKKCKKKIKIDKIDLQKFGELIGKVYRTDR